MSDSVSEPPVALGELARFEMGQSPPSTFVHDGLDDGLPFLQGNADFGTDHPNPRQSCRKPQKVCEEGDALISVRAPVGAINVADRRYCIGRGLAAIRYTAANPSFGAHALRFAAPRLRRVAQGTTFEAVGRRELRALSLWVPPLPEQRQIAAILDTMDDAIRKTEQIIAKLKRVKQGLLHDLLTRGIDENGELRDPERHPEQFKDSPLGRIPRGWMCDRLGAFASVSSGTTPPRTLSLYWSNGTIPWVKTGEVAFSRIVKTEEFVTEAALAGTGLRQFPSGTVLVAMYGQGMTRGRTAILGVPATTNQACAAITGNDALSQPFLFHYLSASYERLRALGHGSHQTNLSAALLLDLPIHVPPSAEQERVVACLDGLDMRSAVERTELAKLRLLKAGLMEDLLTGRVRVTSLLPREAP